MNNYEQGFISKCNEYAVDPALVKKGARGDMVARLLARGRNAGIPETTGHVVDEINRQGLTRLAPAVNRLELAGDTGGIGAGKIGTTSELGRMLRSFKHNVANSEGFLRTQTSGKDVLARLTR